MRLYFVALWVLMMVLMASTLWCEPLRALMVHGRVRKGTDLGRGPLAALLRLEIRKSAWIWFYFIGALYNLAIAVALIAIPQHRAVQSVLCVLQSQSDSVTPLDLHIRFELVLVLILLGVQDARRCLESLWITEFGEATMHVALLGAGLVHYVAIAPSILADQNALAITATAPPPTNLASVLARCALPVIGIALFVFGSYHQYVGNALLAKQKRANGFQHVIPRGHWFEYVRCPLYSTELIIYLAFVLIASCQNVMLHVIFLWVLLNQSVCAWNSSQWYTAKFRDEQLPKWVLVPGIW